MEYWKAGNKHRNTSGWQRTAVTAAANSIVKEYKGNNNWCYQGPVPVGNMGDATAIVVNYLVSNGWKWDVHSLLPV